MSAGGRRNGLQGRYFFRPPDERKNPDWSDLISYLIHPSDWSATCHSKPQRSSHIYIKKKTNLFKCLMYLAPLLFPTSDGLQILKFIFSRKTTKTRNTRTHWRLQTLSRKKWRDSDWIILTAMTFHSWVGFEELIRGRNKENNSILAGVPYRDPPASDLLALHAFVFPLSFPFGRLPRRLKTCPWVFGLIFNFCHLYFMLLI